MMKFVNNLVLALFMVIITAAPTWAIGQGPDGLPAVVKDMLSKAKASVPKVAAADVKAAIDNKEKVIILDVRDGEEFLRGHLPGAMNISRGTLELHVFGMIPDRNAKIYVYCKASARSALAAMTLHEMGYKNTFLMDATLEEWMRAGYPVIK